jgi:hypothetical protein
MDNNNNYQMPDPIFRVFAELFKVTCYAATLPCRKERCGKDNLCEPCLARVNVAAAGDVLLPDHFRKN